MYRITLGPFGRVIENLFVMGNLNHVMYVDYYVMKGLTTIKGLKENLISFHNDTNVNHRSIQLLKLKHVSKHDRNLIIKGQEVNWLVVTASSITFEGDFYVKIFVVNCLAYL